MNFKHAIGFMIVGAMFGSLPSVAPGWFPVNGVDGTSTRGLWLELMSTLQIGIAMTYFASRILASLGMLMETTTVQVTEPQFELPAIHEPEATVSVVRASIRRARPGSILPLPVNFEEGLRRAA